ncbi:DUF1361 domain-containing protein [Chitinophaga parva]|nr:DUF1361 domain-containing protein [Chitinophaga parva]
MKKLLSRLRIYEYKEQLPDWLQHLFIAAFPLAMLGVRVQHTRQPGMMNMAWNIVLALVPLIISTALTRVPRLQRRVILWAPMVFVWLMFLPNAPYMLTDLYHLFQYQDVPRWYDLILLLAFAWAGMVWAYSSLQQMQHFWSRKFPRIKPLVFNAVVFLLTGMGVYMGRYWRWNSWYVFTQPMQIGKGVAGLFLHPHHHLDAWAFTACMAALLWVMRPMVHRPAQA